MLPIVVPTYVNIYPLFNNEITRVIENREAFAVMDASCKSGKMGGYWWIIINKKTTTNPTQTQSYQRRI